MKILVVDDDPACLVLASVALREAGHEVVEAGTGRQAVRLLESGEHAVDLLVTDITMPEMSGLELIRYVRSRPETRCLPVIVCTASDEPELAGRMVQYEIAGCLSKPFEAKRLCAEVWRLRGRDGSMDR